MDIVLDADAAVRRCCSSGCRFRGSAAAARRASGSTRSSTGSSRERRASGGDRGDLLSMLLLAQDDEDKRTRDDRPAGARRGDDDLSRRPRDDRQRAGLDLVSPQSVAGRRSAGCTRRSTACWQAAADGRRRRSRCRTPTRVVTESMRLYPPAWLVGRRAVNEYRIGGYIVPAALDRRHEPVDRAPRPAVLSGARALRSRSLDAGVQGGAAAVRLLPVRRRPAPVHRRIVRVDGAGAGRWRRSRSTGGFAWCPVIRSCRRPPSRCGRSTG